MPPALPEDMRTTAHSCAHAALTTEKDVLRFLTCGSVDDGKSTLIGRLLHDLGQIDDDELAALAKDSKRRTGQHFDLSLLVDGLRAEREQGITIDVAYRYFETGRRKFIVADTPGHAQFTRNMATGASQCDAAVILIDARAGMLTQTRRHCAIVQLLGISQIVLAVNKMDLVGFDQARFEALCDQFRCYAARHGSACVVGIPIVAVSGDNVVTRGKNMPWYTGPTLIDALEASPSQSSPRDAGMVMPVQWVNRSDATVRGYAGTVARGRLSVGDDIVVLPSGLAARVEAISTFDGRLEMADAGTPVMVLLDRSVEIRRGDVLAAGADRPDVGCRMTARLIWLHDEPMLPGRSYLLKCAHQTVSASITRLKHKVDIDTSAETASRQLEANEIGVCDLTCERPLVFTSYAMNRALGAFILIDRVTHQTVGAGMIQHGMPALNVHGQPINITRELRALQKKQRPVCIWFTGLSGAGKSTIANLLDQRLYARGMHTSILDGDNIRQRLNGDLGFSNADRVENIRRVAEVARLMTDAGLVSIVSLISPYRRERQLAREKFAAGEFIEVFVDASLEVCEARDTKGLYKKARAGLIENFTGLASAYEPTLTPEIHLQSGTCGPDELVEQMLADLDRRGFLPN